MPQGPPWWPPRGGKSSVHAPLVPRSFPICQGGSQTSWSPGNSRSWGARTLGRRADPSCSPTFGELSLWALLEISATRCQQPAPAWALRSSECHRGSLGVCVCCVHVYMCEHACVQVSASCTGVNTDLGEQRILRCPLALRGGTSCVFSACDPSLRVWSFFPR